ncbi:MAG TPA: glycosyltransferase family 2 protein, partial [Ignavibacteriaceae bacterium]|nr:glycosyltransferase family 2 protein [Ignavibacteriaceae bacterium]
MKSLSFVIPCLNEEKTLPIVLEKINKVRESMVGSYNTEVVVSDNGSRDNSIEIAKRFSARVVNCSTTGYGAALKYGIENAVGDIIIFADADDTYNFYESPALIQELENGFDLVIGDRINGKIHKGAMPWMHRYLGTPVLTFIINRLYSTKTNRISDCNSGFRCFKKKSFLEWEVKSDGMEFASEMLVNALVAKARISHVPVEIHPDHKERQPHLKTWTDGMRHLLQIFISAPNFFFNLGVALFIISWLIIAIGYLKGTILIGIFSIFGIHSMMLALIGT